MMEAEIYHETAMKQYEDGTTLIDLLSPTEKSKVLDLGCGTGYLSKVLGERVGPGGETVGVDPDKARIKVAKEKYASSNVLFFEGPGNHIPVLVGCTGVIQEEMDSTQPMRELRDKVGCIEYGITGPYFQDPLSHPTDSRSSCQLVSVRQWKSMKLR